MNEIASPGAVDTCLEALPESDRTALQPLAEMLGLRYAFVTREAGTSGGLEASLLSARHLVPVRQLPGGRWDIRIVPLALVLRWSDVTLAAVTEDKAFQLLMATCGFANSVPERSGRPGFRGLG